jgi:hypothetical protein
LVMMQAMRACLMKMQFVEISSSFSSKNHLDSARNFTCCSVKFSSLFSSTNIFSSHLFVFQLVTSRRDE